MILAPVRQGPNSYESHSLSKNYKEVECLQMQTNSLDVEDGTETGLFIAEGRLKDNIDMVSMLYTFFQKLMLSNHGDNVSIYISKYQIAHTPIASQLPSKSSCLLHP